MKRLLFAATVLMTCPSVALAQYDDDPDTTRNASYDEEAGGKVKFGLGMRALMTGLFNGFTPGGGAAVVVDVSSFRIEGIFGLSFLEDTRTTFGFAGRFLYLVHKGKRADLGVGAGVGFSHNEIQGPGNDTTLFHGEGLVQINIFIVENAAINGTLGLGIAAGDGATALVIGGQLSAQIGLTYFFD